jgi:TonB family protein
MSKPKLSTNLMLVVCSILVLCSGAAAQNNLTAKANSIQPVTVAVESDRASDGLAGPVRRVRTEVAKLSNANGRSVEEKRVVLETASYDIRGSKTENRYFPVSGSALTGKEVYKYDDKGNISEMTLLNNDGSLLGKEVYKYDYDSVGNWTRMTTSVAVVEGGKVTFEPSEVTYRSIMYYLDENVLKMAQPVPTVGNTEANTLAAKPAEVRPQPTTPSEAKSQPVSKPAEKQVVAGNNKPAPELPPINRAAIRSDVLNANVLASSSAAPTPAKRTMVDLESEPPAVPTPRPLLKPVSGGVLNGKAVTLPAPPYPEAAKRMRTSGTVGVEVVVDENGKVISAQALSGPAILRESAVQAALKARFSATKLSGQPVKVTGIINYRFSLSQ